MVTLEVVVVLDMVGIMAACWAGSAGLLGRQPASISRLARVAETANFFFVGPAHQNHCFSTLHELGQ